MPNVPGPPYLAQRAFRPPNWETRQAAQGGRKRARKWHFLHTARPILHNARGFPRNGRVRGATAQSRRGYCPRAPATPPRTLLQQVVFAFAQEAAIPFPDQLLAAPIPLFPPFFPVPPKLSVFAKSRFPPRQATGTSESSSPKGVLAFPSASVAASTSCRTASPIRANYRPICLSAAAISTLPCAPAAFHSGQGRVLDTHDRNESFRQGSALLRESLCGR